MEAKKKSWLGTLFTYAKGEEKRLVLSVVLSVFSVMLGLVPFYCMYRLICLFVAGTAAAAAVVQWCLLALLAVTLGIVTNIFVPKWISGTSVSRLSDEFYNLPKDKVVVINNPVDKDFVIRSANISVSPYPKEETVFLNICNIAYSKGIDVLIKAWDKVLSKIPSAHLYIVGRNNTEYARNLVHNAMGKKTVTFLGFQSNPYPYLKYCDCFV